MTKLLGDAMRWVKRHRRSSLALGITVVALGALTGTGLADIFSFTGNDNDWPYATPPTPPVLAAVGDIACQPNGPLQSEKSTDVCTGLPAAIPAQTATANQIEAMDPNLVALLGDEQYQNGLYQDFLGSFDHTYGAFKFLQRPSPGNHEFYTNHGQSGDDGYGYFDYYNGTQLNADGTAVSFTGTAPGGTGTFTQPVPRPQGQAGDFGTNGNGWYSYNLGNWHLISLNIECAFQPGGCSPTGAWLASETQWLASDLQQDHSACTLAYWHQPTFSPTQPAAKWTQDSTEGAAADAWWKLLYAHGADLVLNGHDHVYSRFAPMDPAGNVDPRRGIREFVIGTGGESLDTLNGDNPANTPTPNLQASEDQFYGVMKLSLLPGGYSWDFESALRSPTAPAGTPASYSDTGSGRCHSNGNFFGNFGGVQ